VFFKYGILFSKSKKIEFGSDPLSSTILNKLPFPWKGCMESRVELLPAFKFTGKLVKIKDFTGKW